jgi:hypothetical protein
MGPKKNQFNHAMTWAVVFITSLYLLTGIIGYGTYGDLAVSPILLNLPQGMAKTFSLAIITFHVIFACPLLLTTIVSDMERSFQITSITSRSLSRAGIVAALATVSIALRKQFGSDLSLFC